MSETKPQPGADDPCPTCGGAFRALREPTEEERARAADRDNPIPFPQFVDTATAKQRAELGVLHVCQTCNYQTRVKPDAEPQRDDAPAREERQGTRRRVAAGNGD